MGHETACDRPHCNGDICITWEQLEKIIDAIKALDERFDEE